MTQLIFLGAKNKVTGEYVYPKIANKKDKYICPDCEKDLIVCKGEIRADHFRHKVDTIKPCNYYNNPTESQIHKDAKLLMKTLLDKKTKIIFERNCCSCKYIEEINITEISETSKIELEHRFEYNGLKIADIAHIDNGEIKEIFEIFNSHKTQSENRPEPWFEIDALTLINLVNESNNEVCREIKIPCIRCKKCILCKVKENIKLRQEIKQDIEVKQDIEKAKKILKKWLLIADEKRLYTNFSDLQIYYTSNMEEEHAVVIDYPIVVSDNIDSMTYAWVNWNTGVGSITPTYEDCIKRKYNVLSMIDVVCTHKGSPKYFFNVYHTKPLLKKDFGKLSNILFENIFVDNYLIEIDAVWILNQVSQPNILKINKWCYNTTSEKGKIIEKNYIPETNTKLETDYIKIIKNILIKNIESKKNRLVELCKYGIKNINLEKYGIENINLETESDYNLLKSIDNEIIIEALKYKCNKKCVFCNKNTLKLDFIKHDEKYYDMYFKKIMILRTNQTETEMSDRTLCVSNILKTELFDYMFICHSCTGKIKTNDFFDKFINQVFDVPYTLTKKQTDILEKIKKMCLPINEI
jgi:hypothetical protein